MARFVQFKSSNFENSAKGLQDGIIDLRKQSHYGSFTEPEFTIKCLNERHTDGALLLALSNEGTKKANAFYD